MASARKCALVLAPAMNVEMWQKPANLRNIQQLHKDGIRVLMPASGEQACGEVGMGRMVEPADIVELLPDVWTPKPLRGKRVLISAGATYEAIDPVRGITNISSGQMGVAIARACRRAGAKVSLVHGKMTAEIPFGMAHTEYAESAMDMRDAIFKQLDAGQDVFISVAAVADYRVKNRSIEKLKKGAYGMMPVVKFIENPDILQEVASFTAAPFCVGFAAESENVLANAREKRLKKGVPMMIANDIADAMGKDTTKITIIDDEKETALPEMSKDKAAQMLVARLAAALRPARPARARVRQETPAQSPGRPRRAPSAQAEEPGRLEAVAVPRARQAASPPAVAHRPQGRAWEVLAVVRVHRMVVRVRLRAAPGRATVVVDLVVLAPAAPVAVRRPVAGAATTLARGLTDRLRQMMTTRVGPAALRRHTGRGRPTPWAPTTSTAPTTTPGTRAGRRTDGCRHAGH